MKHPEATPDKNAVLLPHNRIRPNPNQPRQYFDETALAELRESIREHGLRQPIDVRYEPSLYDATPYIIVAGERRWRAAEGVLDKMRCTISNVEAARAPELALIENIQRVDLTALEEARGLADIMAKRELSGRRAARVLNVSEGWVNNRLALLKTSPDVQEVASRVPSAMSSLLLIDTVRDNAGARVALLKAVESGTPHAEIKARVEAIEAEEKWKRDSQQAPDAQTAQRSNLHNDNAGGAFSRGRITKADGQRQAQSTLDAALSEVERHLHNVEAWRGKVSAKYFATEIAPRLQAIEQRARELY